MTYKELFEWGKYVLIGRDCPDAADCKAGADHNVCNDKGTAEDPDAAIDARILLEAVCGTSRETLFVDPDRAVTDDEAAKYEAMIKRRAAHEPTAYILGEWDFMGLTFKVTPDVLIPEQDTETLVEEALTELHDGMRILDLCTGSGCILLSLLHYSNDTYGVGTDISEAALAVARENAERLGLTAEADEDKDGRQNFYPRAEFLRGDLFEALERTKSQDSIDRNSSDNPVEKLSVKKASGGYTGKFHMIVSNPPYISTGVIGTLPDEVRVHEPRLALDGGEDGLIFYRRILKDICDYLCVGGLLMMEIGYDQGEAVASMMRDAGFMEVEVKKDLGGNDRVVRGELGLPA